MPSLRLARFSGISFAFILAATVAAATSCLAGPFSVTLATDPRISAINGGVSYNFAAQEFRGVATASSYTDSLLVGGHGTFDTATSATINIDLKVDDSGNYVSDIKGFTLGGSLDLDNDGIDDATGNLLSGTIIAFGTSGAGPAPATFDVKFLIQGGLLTHNISSSGGGTYSAAFTTGTLGGAILTAEEQTSGILGDFGANFSSDNSGIVAGPLLAAVPLPSSAAMGMILIACMGWQVRNRVAKVVK